MWYNVYNLVNQCLLFISKSFPHLELNAQPYFHIIMHWLTVLHIKSNSSSFWFLVHALLKWYLYLQYLQKESLPRHSHTHLDTPTQTSRPRPHASTPARCEHQTPKIRQLLGDKSCWFDFQFSFFLKTESMGECIWHYNAICFVYISIYGS